MPLFVSPLEPRNTAFVHVIYKRECRVFAHINNAMLFLLKLMDFTELNTDIKPHNQILEKKVQNFNYLGNRMTHNGVAFPEFRTLIALASRALTN